VVGVGMGMGTGVGREEDGDGSRKGGALGQGFGFERGLGEGLVRRERGGEWRRRECKRGYDDRGQDRGSGGRYRERLWDAAKKKLCADLGNDTINARRSSHHSPLYQWRKALKISTYKLEKLNTLSRDYLRTGWGKGNGAVSGAGQ